MLDQTTFSITSTACPASLFSAPLAPNLRPLLAHGLTVDVGIALGRHKFDAAGFDLQTGTNPWVFAPRYFLARVLSIGTPD